MLTMRVLPIGRHRLLLVVGRGCPAASAKVAGFASSASGDVTIRAGEQQKRLSVPSKFSPVLERIDRPKSNNFLESRLASVLVIRFTMLATLLPFSSRDGRW